VFQAAILSGKNNKQALSVSHNLCRDRPELDRYTNYLAANVNYLEDNYAAARISAMSIEHTSFWHSYNSMLLRKFMAMMSNAQPV